jgi:hypothetical protein
MCFSRAIYAEVLFIKMEKLLLDTRWDLIFFNYIFREPSLQLGTGSETTRYLMESLLIDLVSATRQ